MQAANAQVVKHSGHNYLCLSTLAGEMKPARLAGVLASKVFFVPLQQNVDASMRLEVVQVKYVASIVKENACIVVL